jgi:putative SOS response-associated peptidase YedK
MCGRYASSRKPDDLAEVFEVADIRADPLPASYNVAPTTTQYAVLERLHDDDVQRQLRALRWGLVPSWAKDIGIGNKMINARAETLLSKGVFSKPLSRRRCLVPADGYFEWYAEPGRKTKQPFFIRRRDGRPTAMAGLYEIWRDPDGPEEERLWSFTVITTDANEALRHIHDRMPAMLPEEHWAQWLDPAVTDGELVSGLLAPAPVDDFEAYPVSKAVNSVRNDVPELLDPLPPDARSPRTPPSSSDGSCWLL